MIKILKNYIAGFSFIIIPIVVFGFFYKLFWPLPQFIVTPDFGYSDSWHFSIAEKFILWQKLQVNQIPLWTNLLNFGYPILGEGQIGTFFLPNIILFRFLPFVPAYNLSLILGVVLFGSGFYSWFKFKKYQVLINVLLSLTVSFSGMVVLQLTHLSLLQGLSLFPWICLAFENFLKTKTLKNFLIFLLFESQQLFTGFPQAFLITNIFILGLAIYALYQNKKHFVKLTLTGLLGGFCILLLSAVQLLPSWEYASLTNSAKGFSLPQAAEFSFPPKHLLTFINPFILGNPKYGTYPDFLKFDGSIFWENTAFVGLMPIILLIISLILLRKKRVNFNYLIFLYLVLGISFLLMLGKYSPALPFFQIWPFNLFRVPSRFIWLFTITLILISGETLNYIFTHYKNRYLKIGLVFLLFLNLFYLLKTWGNYHQYDTASYWLSQPVLDLNSNDRILTIGQTETHNRIFLTQGWSDFEPYRFLKNTIYPNSNVFWQVPQAGVYVGRFLRRSDYMQNLWQKETTINEKEIIISALGEKIIRLLGVTKLITTKQLSQQNLTNFGLIQKLNQGQLNIYLYKLTGPVPRVYFAQNLIKINALEQIYPALGKVEFLPGKSVLVEDEMNLPSNLAVETPAAETEIKQQSDTHLLINVRQVAKKSLLVIQDKYYPGWLLTVDKQPAPIFAINLTQRGAVIPPGDHQIEFIYQPRSFVIGSYLSISTWLVLLLSLLLPVKYLKHIRNQPIF